jgi:putative transposase
MEDGKQGEDVLIRYDPLDMAEIRVSAQNNFVCWAICQELAGETISLKEIIHARNQQRRHTRAGLDERSTVVEQFLAVHQPESPPSSPRPTHRLKRYIND